MKSAFINSSLKENFLPWDAWYYKISIPTFSHPLYLSSNFYIKALYLHSPLSKNDPSYKDSSSPPLPPPIIPFALYQTYPSNALVQVFTETQRIPKNYFEGSSIVGEESSSEMEENGVESANTFAASLLICAVSTQNRQLPNLQCTHLSCEQFLLSHSRSRARARGEQ